MAGQDNGIRFLSESVGSIITITLRMAIGNICKMLDVLDLGCVADITLIDKVYGHI